jgi:hypothetical protein
MLLLCYSPLPIVQVHMCNPVAHCNLDYWKHVLSERAVRDCTAYLAAEQTHGSVTYETEVSVTFCTSLDGRRPAGPARDHASDRPALCMVRATYTVLSICTRVEPQHAVGRADVARLHQAGTS